eukprot:COSAG06_NODE_42113_length_384_cov_1.638596_1_plen_64_part_01
MAAAAVPQATWNTKRFLDLHTGEEEECSAADWRKFRDHVALIPAPFGVWHNLTHTILEKASTTI